jgi:hypothetical protein
LGAVLVAAGLLLGTVDMVHAQKETLNRDPDNLFTKLEGKQYVVQYSIVLLLLGTGIFVVAKPSGRDSEVKVERKYN